MSGHEHRCMNCGWTASPQKWTDEHERCRICRGRVRLWWARKRKGRGTKPQPFPIPTRVNRENGDDDPDSAIDDGERCPVLDEQHREDEWLERERELLDGGWWR